VSQRCPYCRETIAAGDLYRCPACEAPHHADCWRENNGCTVFGCKCAPPDEPKVSFGGRDSLAISPRHPLPALPSDAAVHLARNGQRFGPYSLSELKRYLGEGRVAPTDLMWTEGMARWTTVAEGLSLHSVSRGNPAPPPLAYGGAVSIASAAGSAGFVKPPSYMLSAILVTLLCCLPFGIVSIVYASQVDSRFNLGDYAGAQASSNSARNWYHAAMISGVIITALLIIGNLSKQQ
jgi:Interferon-induced transmembrane protein/GYF domain 2/Prokaryotic RING finger family 1